MTGESLEKKWRETTLIAERDAARHDLAEARAQLKAARADCARLIRDLGPPHGTVAVPREVLARLKLELGRAIGDGHNLKAFAGTMLRWNEPGIDFSDEAKRIVDHATRWHAIMVELFAAIEELGEK